MKVFMSMLGTVYYDLTIYGDILNATFTPHESGNYLKLCIDCACLEHDPQIESVAER